LTFKITKNRDISLLIITTAHNISIHTCNQFILSHGSKLEPLKIMRQPNNPPTMI